MPGTIREKCVILACQDNWELSFIEVWPFRAAFWSGCKAQIVLLTMFPSRINLLNPHVLLPDFSLHVSLYYRESLVKEVTTTSPEGCRITSSPSSSPSSSPCPEDKSHSGAEIILFPFPYPESHRQGAEMLSNILERGVLLWMTPDGLYARRLCQGRVYWEGPLAPYMDKPNKLEKEQPCKLFDTQQFLIGKHQYVSVALCSHLQVWTQWQEHLCSRMLFNRQYEDSIKTTFGFICLCSSL